MKQRVCSCALHHGFFLVVSFRMVSIGDVVVEPGGVEVDVAAPGAIAFGGVVVLVVAPAVPVPLAPIDPFAAFALSFGFW